MDTKEKIVMSHHIRESRAGLTHRSAFCQDFRFIFCSLHVTGIRIAAAAYVCSLLCRYCDWWVNDGRVDGAIQYHSSRLLDSSPSGPNMFVAALVSALPGFGLLGICQIVP